MHGGEGAHLRPERGVVVLNRDDPPGRGDGPGPRLPWPIKGKAKTPKPGRTAHGRCASVWTRHNAPGDFGLVDRAGHGLAGARGAGRRRHRRPQARQHRAAARRAPPAATDARRRAAYPRPPQRIANALAALALATAIGCPLAPMLHGLREYRRRTAPRRSSLPAVERGVEAFDDSKGTNVGATVAALHGLGADKSPGKLVVILGGDGKGQDFSATRRAGGANVRARWRLIGRGRAQSIEAAHRQRWCADAAPRHAREPRLAWCFEAGARRATRCC